MKSKDELLQGTSTDIEVKESRENSVQTILRKKHGRDGWIIFYDIVKEPMMIL